MLRTQPYIEIESAPVLTLAERWETSNTSTLEPGWYQDGDVLYFYDDGGWMWEVRGEDDWRRVHDFSVGSVRVAGFDTEYGDLAAAARAA